MSRTPAVVDLPDSSSDVPTGAVDALVSALREGAVVGLPTETVYGLAARADDGDALAQLLAAKGIERARALTWHLGSTAALEGWDGFGPRARRLAERYWPGPLTLVLPGVPPGLERVAADDWTGVRVPAHAGIRRVLDACDFPVVATSANATGETPLSDAEAVAAAFVDRVALVGDGGPARMQEASTVLALGPGRFEVLREGLLDRADLARTSGRHIAFVCTGNTCRSPMAQTLARAILRDAVGAANDDALEAVGFRIASFGVYAAPGAPASGHAVTAMEQRGLDLSQHASTPASVDALSDFDEIYGLTSSHVAAVVNALPPRLAERVTVLDPGGRDVADPVGGSLDDYLACAEQIETALRARAADWA